MKTKITLLLFVLLYLFTSKHSFAVTEKYRLMVNGNPSTEITIGWNQVSGTNPRVYWGTVDYGNAWGSYENNDATYRQTYYLGMSNNFVKLENLQPNTVYYFVIHDSNSTSERFWFRTIPDDSGERLSFISGGDSRSGQTQRRNSNKMVAKLRPHAVFFGGDLVNTPGNISMQTWLDDWQLTTTVDNQMIPAVHSFGNHEKYGFGGPELINMLFDTPYDVYYNVRFGGNLFSLYTLNGELLPNHTIPNTTKRNAQKNWLATTSSTDASIWKAAQYHRPIVPHYSGKGEGADEYSDWVSSFYNNGFRLIMESDAHVVKITEEVKPNYSGYPSGNSGYWFTTSNIPEGKGLTFIGEGSWGTKRTPDDSHPITTSMASFYSFNLIFVDNCKIEIRTIDTQSPNSITPRTELTRFDINSDIENVVWKPTAMPSGLRVIRICDNPEAEFSGLPREILRGESVNFTNASTNNPTSFSWTFEGGTPSTSSQQNPANIVYNTEGIYDVSLTVSNNDGSDTETKTDYIKVLAPNPPSASFEASKTDVAVGEEIVFTDLSAGAPATWEWTFVGGTPASSTLQNPTVTYSASGTYSVTLKVSNTEGSDIEIKTDYITVKDSDVLDIPIVDTNDDVEEKESNGELYFDSSDLELVYDTYDSQGHQTIGLRFQNVNVPQGALISNSYIQFRSDEPNLGDITLTIFGHDADNSEVFSGNYGVSNRPKTTASVLWSPSAWASSGLSGASQQTSDISSIVQEIVKRTGWVLNNSMSFIINDDGADTDKRVADSYDGGWAPKLHIEYTIPSNLPEADFTADQTTIVEGGSVNFTDATTNNPTSWEWTFVGGTPSSSTAQNPSVTYSASGTYAVTLKATNTHGSDTETKTGYITVSPLVLPEADFTADQTTIVEGGSVNFTDATTNNPTSWEWTFVGGTPLSSTAQNPTVTYSASGTYAVTLKATNTHGSDTETKTGYITVGGANLIENSNGQVDKVVVYPNPAYEEIFVVSGEKQNYNLDIMNLAGVSVYSSKGFSEEERFDISEIKGKGIFIVKIIFDDNKQFNFKLVLE